METKSLTPAAKAGLRRYHWPGNVRELCHRLESAVLLCWDFSHIDISYRFINHRRMRSNELHYIDHPMFGVLVIATPLQG